MHRANHAEVFNQSTSRLASLQITSIACAGISVAVAISCVCLVTSPLEAAEPGELVSDKLSDGVLQGMPLLNGRYSRYVLSTAVPKQSTRSSEKEQARNMLLLSASDEEPSIGVNGRLSCGGRTIDIDWDDRTWSERDGIVVVKSGTVVFERAPLFTGVFRSSDERHFAILMPHDWVVNGSYALELNGLLLSQWTIVTGDYNREGSTKCSLAQ